MVFQLRITKVLFTFVALGFLLDKMFILLLSNSSKDEQHLESEEIDEDTCHQTSYERLHRIRRVCDELGISKELEPDLRNCQINLVHNAFICVPHKAGSESWRIFFERLDSRDRNNSDWRDISPKAFPSKMSHFTRAIQVRHPIERLVSSYRYVFEYSDLKRTAHLNVRLLERYQGYDRHSHADGIFPRQLAPFSDFVRFLVHGEEDFPGETDLLTKGASSHWAPQYIQCNPCSDLFQEGSGQHLIHMDSVEEDTYCYLDDLKGLEAEDTENLYKVNVSPSGHSSGLEVKKKYIGQLTRSDLEGLYRKFRPDFELHGYGIEEYFQFVKAQE